VRCAVWMRGSRVAVVPLVSDVDLVNKLDVAEQKLRPPPPPPAPPPPPPSFLSPLRLLIKKKPASASSSATATSRAGSELLSCFLDFEFFDLNNLIMSNPSVRNLRCFICIRNLRYCIWLCIVSYWK